MIAEITKEVVKAAKPGRKPYEIRDTELKGFLLRIQPSGVRSYILRYGNDRRITLGRSTVLTPLQAREKARRLLAELVLEGRDPQAERDLSKMDTLGEFVEQKYSGWAKANLKSSRETLRKIDALPQELKAKKLAEITAWIIEKHRTDRLKSVSASTSNRELATLRAALQKAVEWGILKDNPLRSVKQKRQDSNPIVRYLTDAEAARLRETLERREATRRKQRDDFNQWRRERGYKLFPDYAYFTDHLKPMVLLALNTGLRRGELFNLKWPDIDFSTRILTVVGASAKGGHTRHIPLNQEAYAILQRWREQSRPDVSLVFPSYDGERMDNVSTSWERLVKQAKIRNFRFHDLRHDFASKLVMAGVDLNTVRELLGHADIKMTLRYAHLAPEHKAAAVAKLMQR